MLARLPTAAAVASADAVACREADVEGLLIAEAADAAAPADEQLGGVL